LKAEDVLRRYREEELPAFCGVALDNVNARGTFGERPLEVAAGRGMMDEVEALLDGGAEINAHGELGNTALHAAVGQGHLEVVRLLLMRGASRLEKNEDGFTPFDVAKLLEHEDLVAILEPESAKEGNTP
jgi:ankyrin repeat protein